MARLILGVGQTQERQFNTMWTTIITLISSIIFTVSGIVFYYIFNSRMMWKQTVGYFVSFNSSMDVMTTIICYKDNNGDPINYEYNGGKTSFKHLKSGDVIRLAINGDTVEIVEMIEFGIFLGKIFIGIGLFCMIIAIISYEYPNAVVLF